MIQLHAYLSYQRNLYVAYILFICLCVLSLGLSLYLCFCVIFFLFYAFIRRVSSNLIVMRSNTLAKKLILQ